MGVLREHAGKFIAGFSAVASIVALFLVLPWPWWLIAALGVVIVFLLYLVWVVMPPRIDLDDQARLDELLHILNRRAEEHIAMQDFYATWNARIMNPLRVFAERGGIEHHFKDKKLETKRAALYKATLEFLEAESLHGFPPQGWGTTADRVAGYSPSEAEGLREREQAVEEHRSAIFPAAQAFLRAHGDLVREARDRGYNVDALKRERHPEVRKWDQIHEEAEQRAYERGLR